jgi:Asp-tRNA(Asn)/Glu-tRNA(Gln) amidotransferase A subunit family amidase
VKGLSDYLDTIGAVARSVEDVAFFSSVLTGDGALRSLPTAMRPRVGVCKAHWDGLTPAAQQVIDDAAAALSAAGAQVIELPFSDDLHALTQAHIDIMAFEVARTLADERLRHLPLISAPLRAVIDKGLAMPYAHYAAQLQQVARVRAGLPARWSDVDVVLAPSAAGEAPLFEAGTGDPTWCRAWTVLGLPCIHLPFATGPQGLPLGLQVVGPLHGDHMALATAAWIHARLTR